MNSCCAAESLEPRTLLTGIIHTIDFEDVGAALNAESAFNGPVPGGTQQLGPFDDQIVVGEFAVQSALFNNVYSLDFNSWSGWAYSNRTDNATPGFTNDLSSFSGSGAGDSATYGVSFVDAFSPSGPPSISLAENDVRSFDSLKLNNNTYAGLSMQLGDSFAKKFGGVTGNDPDWFLLTITGKDAGDDVIGTIEFYLADYRATDNSQDYIIDQWTEVDVSSLSAARSLEFTLASSDNGSFGMNTPAYFAIDDLVLIEPAADLAPTAFNAVDDHVLSGRTDVTYTVENRGNADAGAFSTQVVWSRNNIPGDADDVVVANSIENFAGLAEGATVTRTQSLQLDREALLSHSIAADPAGGGVGTVSLDVSQLFLIVDSQDDVAESDETNNSGLNRRISSDDITHFPWDKNGNGVVEPLEALTSVHAIGTSDELSDLNGDGIVTPLEALAILQRIGYVRNDGPLSDPALKAPLSTLTTKATTTGSENPVNVSFASVTSRNGDDEETTDRLFELAGDHREPVIPVSDPENESTAMNKKTQLRADWLNVLS